MKKCLLIAAIAMAVGAQSAFALDLLITKKDGKVVTVNGLKEIAFNEAEVKAVGATTETLNFADLDSFQFDKSSDGTGAVADLVAIGVKFDGSAILLPGAGNVKVYNVAGALCKQGVNVESLSVAELPAGVYAVEVATESGRAVSKIYKK